MNENNLKETNEELSQLPPKDNILSTISLILSIITICISFFNTADTFILCIILSIVGMLLAALSIGRCESRWIAMIGFIGGLFALFLSVFLMILYINNVDNMTNNIKNQIEYNDSLSNTSDPTEYILENHLDVQFGNFTAIEHEYTTDSELLVTLKNKGTERKSFRVKIEAIDQNGNRIDEDYLYVSDLAGGQGQTVKAFKYVSKDIVDSLKKASFRVISVSMY